MNGSTIPLPAVDSTAEAPFRLRWGGSRLAERALVPIARLLGLTELDRVYEESRSGRSDFCGAALDALGVSLRFDEDRLRTVPREGPLVIVSNHPFGGLDGLALRELVARVRPDVRLLANHVLHRVPELREICFFVDPFDRPESKRRNIAAMRSAARWVEQGGALIVFPAGEVAHADWRTLSVSDPPWKGNIGRLIQRCNAAVVPMFFNGANSGLFHAAGFVSPWLRTLLLGRELLNKRDRQAEIAIGLPIAPERLGRFQSPEDVIAYLRVRTFMLREAAPTAPPSRRLSPKLAPIAAPGPRERIARDVASLGPQHRLLCQGGRSVFAARAHEVPYVLEELGRLRERTFREVGEGTGQPTDIDRFDETYTHLFVWDETRSSIVGAYRIGHADEIVRERGVEGLYTNTLFRYRRELLDQIGPALELGRSFVVPEWQRSFWPLLSLWRGIGRYVVAHPRYRHLFGPVSISDEYRSMSKQMLVAFLERSRCASPLARLLAPRRPVRPMASRDWSVRDQSVAVRELDEVDALVREIESDRCGVPILLRQYLRLNAVVLGCNVDPEFGNVIDALVLIDLAKVERRLLNQYLGDDGAADFLLRHATQSETSSTR